MTQNLIVYYSRTGTARQVAEALAARLGWRVAEIADVTSRAGMFGDLRCVIDNLFQRAPAYRYNGPEPSECGHVIVLAPVWMGRLAAPMRAFLAANAPSWPADAGVSAICVMSSRGGYQAMKEIAALTATTPAPALVLLQRDVLSGTAAADIDRFVQALRAAETGSTEVQRPAWLSPNAT